MSERPPATVHESATRLTIQLKQVLDRIDLPLVESVADAGATTKAEVKSWTLPNSEIQIRRVEIGPRAGE